MCPASHTRGVTHVDHLLLRGRELRLEVLGESLPVNVLDIALGLLQLLLDLFDHSLGIVAADLLDFVNDTLEVLVLEVGQEAVDTAVLLGKLRVQSESPWREEALGQSAEGLGLLTASAQCQSVYFA